MQILSTRDSVRAWRQRQTQQGKTVAFVPTMGNLHQGHLSLIKLAKLHAPTTLVSLFVNPTQFGANEDFDQYPRTQQADLAALKTAGVDAVFIPDSDRVLYPQSTENVLISLPPSAHKLCGLYRPGHFEGVLQVVNKLFNLCQPNVAVFGEKDYQQLQLISSMVTDFLFPIQIIAGPTLREASGLALSSRNQRLDEQTLSIAPKLNEALKTTCTLIQQGSLDQPEARQEHGQQQLAQLNALGFQMQYFEILDGELNPLSNLKIGKNDKGIVVLGAGYLNNVRLIDNVIVQRKTVS